MANPPPYGTCEICRRNITKDEDTELNLDRDFVVHHGHLIRRPSNLPNFEVFHDGKSRWILFWRCQDVREAKERFQWRYGYWPSQVREVMA